MKIVCDTNVLVSGIIFAGPPRRILALASRGDVVNFTSPELLREVEDVLRRAKFGLRPAQVTGIIALFRDTFEIVHPARRIEVVTADPADDRVLEAAATAAAVAIVSGDRHLLDLTKWEGIQILPPAAFLSERRRRAQ